MYHLELNKTLVYLHTHTHTKPTTQTLTILYIKYCTSKINVVFQNNYVIAHGILKTLHLPREASFLMG